MGVSTTSGKKCPSWHDNLAVSIEPSPTKLLTISMSWSFNNWALAAQYALQRPNKQWQEFWGIILFGCFGFGFILGFFVSALFRFGLVFLKKSCISKKLRTLRYFFQEKKKNCFPIPVLLKFPSSAKTTFPLSLVLSLPPISLPDQLKCTALLLRNHKELR